MEIPYQRTGPKLSQSTFLSAEMGRTRLDLEFNMYKFFTILILPVLPLFYLSKWKERQYSAKALTSTNFHRLIEVLLCLGFYFNFSAYCLYAFFTEHFSFYPLIYYLIFLLSESIRLSQRITHFEEVNNSGEDRNMSRSFEMTFKEMIFKSKRSALRLLLAVISALPFAIAVDYRLRFTFWVTWHSLILINFSLFRMHTHFSRSRDYTFLFSTITSTVLLSSQFEEEIMALKLNSHANIRNWLHLRGKISTLLLVTISRWQKLVSCVFIINLIITLVALLRAYQGNIEHSLTSLALFFTLHLLSVVYFSVSANEILKDDTALHASKLFYCLDSERSVGVLDRIEGVDKLLDSVIDMIRTSNEICITVFGMKLNKGFLSLVIGLAVSNVSGVVNRLLSEMK